MPAHVQQPRSLVQQPRKVDAFINPGGKIEDLGVVSVILLRRQNTGKQQGCINGGEFRVPHTLAALAVHEMVIPSTNVILVVRKMAECSANPLPKLIGIHPSPVRSDTHRSESKTRKRGAGAFQITTGDIRSVRADAI